MTKHWVEAYIDQDTIASRLPNGTTPPPGDLLAMLADEIADAVIYADLLAQYYDIDLAAAVIAKFNAVSVREGFPERLAKQSPAPPAIGTAGDDCKPIT